MAEITQSSSESAPIVISEDGGGIDNAYSSGMDVISPKEEATRRKNFQKILDTHKSSMYAETEKEIAAALALMVKSASIICKPCGGAKIVCKIETNWLQHIATIT